MALPLFYAAGQTKLDKPDSPEVSAQLLPDGPGKDVVLKKCTSCHSVRNVIARRATADDWALVVSKMIGRGASISDDEGDTIVNYLADHFGPTSPKPGQSSPPADASHPASSAAPAAATPKNDSASSTSVDINKATADQLMATLALTQEVADKIVHHREQNGNFKNLQQLIAILDDDSAAMIKKEQSKIEF
jgi:DNA uptake protein ComE-like DNA-binding protein